ncbi:hypothetical protein Ga0123462_0212 [Mariprofundus ferrinatatus]|uniref:DUF985 domain-containing protein n=1 Tax=Mariprofundus ferrinatatus TaxID=1921087 RepID=A0A2K8L196_9PROT|nr:cupin domain-containing protein [Mariprofundus ferrinatatus]ATX81090.1 hypothetical protein Ga0123462_0212 [Mariprofundus ferrinatatus]
MSRVQKIIHQLALKPHPEGGWYREIYRSAESVPPAGLPPRFGGARAFATSIYFLLEGSDFSAFHRIRQDELWHFYDGDGLTIHVIDKSGGYSRKKLGRNPDQGEAFHHVVAAGDWFGATVSSGGFALVGCTVVPGFDFDDFEMAERHTLLQLYPQHRDIIARLTRS